MTSRPTQGTESREPVGPRSTLPRVRAPWDFLGAAAVTLVGVAAYSVLPEEHGPRAVSFVALQLALAVPALAVLLFRREQAIGLWWVLGVAAVVRLATLPSELIFENDVFRYLWDARVASDGINPYRYAPAASELSHLVDDWVFPQIPYRQVPTVYPPLAQGVFLLARAVGGESVIALQAVMIALDLGTVAAVWALGRALVAPRAAAAYALHPLVLKELSQAAHVDTAAVLLVTVSALLLVRRRTFGAAAALGGATLVKVFPLFTLVALLRRLSARGLLVYGAVVGAPLLALALSGVSPFEGLEVFTRFWIFNPSLYDGVVRLLSLVVAPEVAFAVGRPVCGGLLAVVLVAIGLEVKPSDDRSVLHGVLAAMLALLLCSPAANPWYVAWLTPLALVLRSPPALAFTFLAPLAYAFYALGEDLPWTRALEYAPVYGLVGLALFQRLRPEKGQKNLPHSVPGNASSP